MDHRLSTSPEKTNKKNSEYFFPLTSRHCSTSLKLQCKGNFARQRLLVKKTQLPTINKIL